MSTDEIFVTRFRELCKNSKLTQTDMAYKPNMTQSALSKQLNGKNRVSADVLVRISDFFNTSTDYLLGKTDRCYVFTLEGNETPSLPPEIAKAYDSLEVEGKEVINTMIVYLAQQNNNLR